jgi:hypothetical protein
MKHLCPSPVSNALHKYGVLVVPITPPFPPVIEVFLLFKDVGLKGAMMFF